jgi:hypothetical protein
MSDKNNWKFKPTQQKAGLTWSEYGEAGAKDHFRRGLDFAKGGAMYKENFLNSVGLLTKHQRQTGGFANRAIGLGSAGFMAHTLLTGGRLEDVASLSLSGFGFLAGFRPAKEVGQGVAKMFGAGRALSYGTGILAGGVVGAALGITAGAVPYMADNNNAVQKFGSSINKASLFNDVKASRDTLTHRQKMIQKLAKSGLNDRGQLLGSEAMIIRGIL